VIGSIPACDVAREEHLPGVAVDDVDRLERDTEAIGYELGERRLVALAVAVRAGEDGDAAGWVDAHFCHLVEAGACITEGAIAQASI
jgi:hypothetical protein